MSLIVSYLSEYFVSWIVWIVKMLLWGFLLDVKCCAKFYIYCVRYIAFACLLGIRKSIRPVKIQ